MTSSPALGAASNTTSSIRPINKNPSSTPNPATAQLRLRGPANRVAPTRLTRSERKSIDELPRESVLRQSGAALAATRKRNTPRVKRATCTFVVCSQRQLARWLLCSVFEKTKQSVLEYGKERGSVVSAGILALSKTRSLPVELGRSREHVSGGSRASSREREGERENRSRLRGALQLDNSKNPPAVAAFL